MSQARRCRVPGCSGMLDFFPDNLGRLVDSCPECARRVDQVTALTAIVNRLRAGRPMPPFVRTDIAQPTVNSEGDGFKPRICALEGCDTVFIPRGARQLYCSPECRRERDNEIQAEYKKRREAKLAAGVVGHIGEERIEVEAAVACVVGQPMLALVE